MSNDMIKTEFSFENWKDTIHIHRVTLKIETQLNKINTTVMELFYSFGNEHIHFLVIRKDQYHLHLSIIPTVPTPQKLTN